MAGHERDIKRAYFSVASHRAASAAGKDAEPSAVSLAATRWHLHCTARHEMLDPSVFCAEAVILSSFTRVAGVTGIGACEPKRQGHVPERAV